MTNENDRSVVGWKVFLLIYLIISMVTIVLIYRCWEKGNIDNAKVLNTKLETEIGTHIPGRNLLINVNGEMRNILGINTMNGVMKLNNNHLVTLQGLSSEETIQSCAQKLNLLNNYLIDNQVILLYVSTPYAISDDKEYLPAGINDYSNLNVARLKEYLEEYGVDYIDIHEEFKRDNLNQYDYFFRTDHHWTMEGGLYAYGKIADYLCNELHCDADVMIKDINSYSIETYEKYHFGSTGLRVGQAFAEGADDFDVLIPKFDVHLLRDDGIEITNMHEYYNKSETVKRNYNSSFYDRYLGNTNRGYVNNMAQNDKKILFISDSMGLAIYPYLAMGFHEIRAVGCTGLTKELIDGYKPDAVVIVHYPIELQASGAECFKFTCIDE